MNKPFTKLWLLGQLLIGILLTSVILTVLAPIVTSAVTPIYVSFIVWIAVGYILVITWKKTSHPFTYVISAVMLMLAIFNMIYASDSNPSSQRTSGAISAFISCVGLLTFLIRFVTQERIPTKTRTSSF